MLKAITFLLLLTYLFTCSTGSMSSVFGYTNMYIEDFSTITYLDDSVTNASGWGENEVSLSVKEPEYPVISNYPIGKDTNYVTTEGNYAYVSTVNEVKILDITDVSNPIQIGSFPASDPNMIVVSGDYMYVQSCYIFYLVDISDPSNPQMISSIDSEHVFHDNFYVKGDHIYILEGSLNVYNISNPNSPYLEKRYFGASGAEFILSGDLYIERDYSRLFLRRFPIVAHWVFLSNIPIIGHITGISLDGIYLFQITSEDGFGFTNGLEIYDISNQLSPEFLGYIEIEGYFENMCVDGDFVYISSSEQCHIINISSPSDPIKCAEISFGSGYNYKITHIHAEGQYIFITYNRGMKILKTSEFIKPTLLGEYSDFLSVQGIKVDGDLAYIGSGYGRSILNLTDLSAPSKICDYGSSSTFYIETDGRYVYSIDDMGVFDIYNTTDLTSPSLTGTYYSGMGITAFDKFGDFALVVSATEGIHIVNVSGHTNPSFVSSSTFSGMDFALGIKAAGDLAYLITFSGFHVLNITDIHSITQLGECSVSGMCYRMIVQGDYVLAATNNGILIFDVSDATNPILTTTYAPSTIAYDMFLSGKFLYAVIKDGSVGSVQRINITDVTNPILLDSFNRSRTFKGIAVDGDYAFVLADQTQAEDFFIIEFQKNKARIIAHETLCVAQSTLIYSNSSTLIHNATISSSANTPSNTNITYFLTADNGLHWEQLLLDSDHSFTFTGNQLKWKAILESSDVSLTPSVYSISIGFNTTVIIAEFAHLHSILLVATVLVIIVKKRNWNS